jgi:hypothetical protein
MTKQVQLRRGTTAEHSVFTGAVGELTVDTTLDVAVVHDGVKVGGHPLVGTTAAQSVTNKLSVGIGTTNATSQLTVVGDVLVAGSGILTARSLNIDTRPSISRSGNITGFSTNVITGISTDQVRSGDLVSITGTNVSLGTSYNSSVTSLEINRIVLSEFFDTGLVTSRQGYFSGISTNKIVGILTDGLEVGYAITSLPNVSYGTTIVGFGTTVGEIVLSLNAQNDYQGFVFKTGDTTNLSPIITGIDTSGIKLGAVVEGSDEPTLFPENTTVISIGVGQIEVDQDATSDTIATNITISYIDTFYLAPSSISTSFTITDLTSGKANIDTLISDNTYTTNSYSENIYSSTIGSRVGILTLTDNVNVSAALTSNTLRINKYSSIVRNGNIVPVLPSIITGIDTTGISRGDSITASVGAGVTVGNITDVSIGYSSTVVSAANSSYSSLVSIGGSGTGATFNVSRDGSGGISTVTIENGGSGYKINDILTISGSSIDGTDGLDDLLLNVTNIIDVWQVSAGASVTNIGIGTIFLDGSINTGGLLILSGSYLGAFSTSIIGINTTNIQVGYGITNELISGVAIVTGIETGLVLIDRPASNTNPEYFDTLGDVSVGSTVISGIDTSNILVNSEIISPYFASGTEVLYIGSSQVSVSNTSNTTASAVSVVFIFQRTFYSASLVGVTSSFTFDNNYRGRAFLDVSIGNTITYNNAYITSSYVNSGIITTAGISSGRIDNAYITSGVATEFNISTGLVDNLSINSGVATIVGVTSLLYANSGIITEAGIGSAFVTDLYANSGIITNIGITSGTADTLYIREGIATALGINSSFTDLSFINSGIITTAGISSGRVDNLYASVGVITNVAISTAGISTLYASVGLITNFTAGSIDANSAQIDNVSIGIGNTDLIVNGDARITGILTIGSSSVTIDGLNSNISGVSSITGTVGVFTDVQIAGINTFNNLRKNVTLRASDAGIATDYTLVLPPAPGRNGQLLGLNADGTLGFATGTGLYENRYYVSSVNGDDTNDGKTLPVKTIKRASQLASFDSFVIPGQRYLDAGNLLEDNKEFIQEEVVAYLEFNYEDINTQLPDYDPEICKRDVGYLVDALVYDIRFGGNSKSREAGLAYWDGNTNYVAGEEEQAIFAYEYIRFIGQYIINNQSPPTLYQTAVSQTFDFTIIQDPLNTNSNYFHRSKDARNLIVGNRQEIIDKSLASVALAATTGFFFPGEEETNERSRYYDSYKLIQINKQEILDKSIASIALGFPTGFYVPGSGITSTTNDSRYYDAYRLIQINKDEIVATALTAINNQYPSLWTSGVSSDKCARDLGYFVDAVSTDVFTGGNNYAREFTGFYFVGVGTTSLAGEEQQTIYGFQQAGIQMRNAITNQLTNKNLNVSVGPAEYGGGGGNISNTSTSSCTDVQNTITSLVGIVTDAIGAATTSGLPAVNYGDFDLNVIGFGTTAGIWKCARDTGFFIDAVSTDVFTGGNNYVRSFTGFYFTNVGAPLGNGLVGETAESNYVFESARDYMKKAITNQLNGRDLTITADPVTGFNTDPNSCSNVQSTITTLTGIVTTAIGSGSTAGIGTTTNYGYFLVNSTFNVKDFVGIGTTNVVGGRKCARDLGYIVDAIAQDVSYGTNQHIVYATKKYFNGAGTARTDGLLGEEAISAYAFQSAGKYAKQAVTNWLNYQDLSIVNDVAIGATNKNPNVCANTRSTIDSLVGILTGAILSGSLSGITSVNLGLTDCADVRSALVNYVGIITTIVGLGTTAAPELSAPQTLSQPVCIIVEAGEYLEDNPIILYDDVAVVGDNLRNTIIRPLNAGKDLLRVRNGVYLTGFAMKDSVDLAGVPQNKFDYAVAFDDPSDPFTSRAGYATKLDKPIISRSPYIQNCSILSFLGANGILVDGNKVQSPNTPLIPEEAEVAPDDQQPEQGKSMVAAAFTMVSFGGIGWRTINDGYAQVVSCFQIFCRYGSLAQSGGYLSITNSATNFGFYALRATGFSRKSFIFDRGRIAATGTSGGLQTLKAVGYGRSDLENYVLQFFDDDNVNRTSLFKPASTSREVTATNSTVGVSANTITIINHGFVQGDAVVYNGDEQVIPPRIIGGLVNDTQYYIGYIDNNTFSLYEDDGLETIVDITTTSTGIHTFTKATQDFFVKEIIVSGTHNEYQKLTLAGIGSTAVFVSGRQITQTVIGGSAVGFAVTYNQSTKELIVAKEISGGIRRNFAISDGVSVLNITDHSASPISIGVTAVAGLSTYWTIEFKTDSTTAGNQIINLGNLPETYKLHFHRPSIINSSSHTWEFSGSGTDYNALPENGGQTDVTTEQVSELGGRVYTSGTNELGDFKIGRDITAFNRTGNIIFNNTVTIGTLDSLRLSLSGGVAVEEFSTDTDLGDNELGGPQHKRVSTQLAVRTFLNNRLGNFIDKLVSTNAIPNAVVQLNATGQINADLIPPKTANYYRVANDGGRLQLANYIPATSLQSGDTVVEPTAPFVLISDTVSQYLVLNNNTIYNFQNDDVVTSVVSAGGAVGVVTAPPYIGVATNIVDAGVGYGTTGLVRGVPLTLNSLSGGSGYNTAGIYTGVRLDTSTGIGTGISATITVSAAGTVSNVAINTGGYKFEVGDILTLNDPSVIGGRTGGGNFSINVGSVETRLYLSLTNGLKFPGSAILPDYIADRNAVAISTNIGIGSTVSFNPTDFATGGDVDFGNDRIILGPNHKFADGDPVIYSNGGGTTIADLVDGLTYYIKKVGLSSVQLYTTYGLVTLKDLSSSGTGTHKLSRVGINTFTDQITFINHGFSQGDPVLVTGNTPVGITTGNFYFVGSVTQNSFTLHTTRAQSLTSINGLLLNTVDLSGATINDAVGIMTFTEQNIEYSASVNTSSTQESNWSLLATGTLDASNIVSGIFSPTRLGTGAANENTFLAGNSTYLKVVKSIGIGTTQPVAATATSSDLAPGGVGVNTYYGNVQITLNRVQTTPDEFSTLGISKFKTSTFTIGADGAVSIKNSIQGDLDAATLGGQPASYFLDIANSTGTIPISRGGTGVVAAPSEGFMLLGNGSSYTLTGSPEFAGTVSAGFAVLANKDIVFTTGTWTGEKAAKIQYHSNNLYNQYTGSWIARNSGGTNVFTIDSSGNTVASGTFQATTLTSTQTTGTAPFTVSSTTLVTNLNADLLDGINSSSFMRTDANTSTSGTLTLSGDVQDLVDLTANSTNDNRGIAFNSRTALSADFNDGYLRLNNASEFTNGVYTPGTLRVDGTLLIDSTRGLTDVTGEYGNVQTTGTGVGSWQGYSISGRAVFMHDNGTNCGIYNDTNNQWMFYGVFQAATYMYYNGSSKFETTNTGVSVTGALTASSNITAYSSDRRLKENFKHIESPLEKVLKLNGYTFDWTIESRELGFIPKHDTNDIGLIAQEVEAVLPQAVAPAPFDLVNNPETHEMESKSGQNYLTVQYERIVPLLVEAIKEQNQMINNLRDEIESLKSKFSE